VLQEKAHSLALSFSTSAAFGIAALALMNWNSAHAAGIGDAAITCHLSPSAVEANDNVTLVMAANHRETNLRKSATSIIVMGVQELRSQRTRR
jgi:hypothetical protein